MFKRILTHYEISFTDEYFLVNVRTVDELTDNRRLRLVKANNWIDCGLERSVATWPCFNVLSDLPASETRNKKCAACNADQGNVRIIMYGQPYNNTTLDGSSPDPKVANQKVKWNFCLYLFI